MKIEHLYYTVKQLAAHWNYDIDYVMELGLTDRLKFIAQVDWHYPFIQKTERGLHTPVDYQELANIYHATESFTETGFCNFGDYKGLEVVITYYHGIDRLIINASEVKRFENEQNQTNSDAPPIEMSDDAHAAFLEFWNIEPYPHITNKTVENWLIENRNVSPTKAASIATYIRPKSAPKGRPKKK